MDSHEEEGVGIPGSALGDPPVGASPESGGFVEEPPLALRCAIKALGRCALVTGILLARRRIRQPTEHVGMRLSFGDGTTAAVYRETVIDRPPPAVPTVLVVCFRLRRVRSEWVHALFRLESILNTVLFAGFAGLVSKLWLRHDQRGVYRGFYQWDDPAPAVAYVRALWWVLALVSEPGSIHYRVLPGLRRDEVLRDPALVDKVAPAQDGGWWRLVGTEARGSDHRFATRVIELGTFGPSPGLPDGGSVTMGKRGSR